MLERLRIGWTCSHNFLSVILSWGLSVLSYWFVHCAEHFLEDGHEDRGRKESVGTHREKFQKSLGCWVCYSMCRESACLTHTKALALLAISSLHKPGMGGRLKQSWMSSSVFPSSDFKSHSILQYFEQAIFVQIWTVHFVSDVQEVPGQQSSVRVQGQPAVHEDPNRTFGVIVHVSKILMLIIMPLSFISF